MPSTRISKHDVKRTTEDAYQLFVNGIKSEETRDKYIQRLKLFLCITLEDILQGDPQLREKQRHDRLAKGKKKEIKKFLDADFEVRVREFVEKSKKDTKWALDILLTYSAMLKKRTQISPDDPSYMNPSTIPNMFKPTQKLFKMNGIPFVWEQVTATYPERDNEDDTRGYEIDEIRHVLDYCDAQARAVILILSSSSIRRGGLEFKWENICPVYRRDGRLEMGKFDDEDDSSLVCGMVSIYHKSNQQYMALFSPETWKAIKNYRIQCRQEVGAWPKHGEWFLKRAGRFGLRLSPNGMAEKISDILKNAGVRTNIVDGKHYEVPLMNGFRRFFDKQVSDFLTNESPLGTLIKRERLMGHRTGLIPLDRNYYKNHWRELVEEYLQCIPALTISREDRIKLQLEHERKKNAKITDEQRESIKEEISREFRHEIEELKYGFTAREAAFNKILVEYKDKPATTIITRLLQLLFEVLTPEERRLDVWKALQEAKEKGETVNLAELFGIEDPLAKEEKIGLLKKIIKQKPSKSKGKIPKLRKVESILA